MNIEERARLIIVEAIKREPFMGTVARFYGQDENVVRAYAAGLRVGTLPSREVVRIEISRLRAIRTGEKIFFFPVAKDKYKGLREY